MEFIQVLSESMRLSIFTLLRGVLLSTVLFMVSGCGGDPFWLPRAHRITIQQGNLISERQLSAIEVGMDQNAVRTLLGSPIANTQFNANRWDYIYTQAPAGAAVTAKRVAITFENELVSNIDTNAAEQDGELKGHSNWWEKLFPPKRAATGL